MLPSQGALETLARPAHPLEPLSFEAVRDREIHHPRLVGTYQSSAGHVRNVYEDGIDTLNWIRARSSSYLHQFYVSAEKAATVTTRVHCTPRLSLSVLARCALGRASGETAAVPGAGPAAGCSTAHSGGTIESSGVRVGSLGSLRESESL